MQAQLAQSHIPDQKARSPLGPVTLDEVKQAVEKLKAAGARVSRNAVLAEIGRGSKTTICDHFARLQLADEASTPDIPAPLSASLLAELAKEVDRVVKARSSQLKDGLDDAQNALAAVVSESEAYRLAAEEAESVAGALRLSLAEQTGIAEALRAQCDSLRAQLVDVNEAAERGARELVVGKERHRLAEERATRAETESERSRSELRASREDALKLREQLELKTRECMFLQQQAETGHKTAASLEKALQEKSELQADLTDAMSRLATSEAQRQGLGERLQDTQSALARAEAAREQLLQKVLQGTTGARESAPSAHTVAKDRARE